MAPEGTARPERRAPTTAEGYRYWVDENVRFGDLDLLGHVNNRSYLDYAESVRAPFLSAIGLWTVGRVEQSVLAHVEIDFLRELHYPNRLRLGASVLSVGNTSFSLAHGVFCNDVCTGTISARLVWIDTRSRRPIPLGLAEREALMAWRVPTV